MGSQPFSIQGKTVIQNSRWSSEINIFCVNKKYFYYWSIFGSEKKRSLAWIFFKRNSVSCWQSRLKEMWLWNHNIPFQEGRGHSSDHRIRHGAYLLCFLENWPGKSWGLKYEREMGYPGFRIWNKVTQSYFSLLHFFNTKWCPGNYSIDNNKGTLKAGWGWRGGETGRKPSALRNL